MPAVWREAHRKTTAESEDYEAFSFENHPLHCVAKTLECRS
jgi:hypothetical protein